MFSKRANAEASEMRPQRRDVDDFGNISPLNVRHSFRNRACRLIRSFVCHPCLSCRFKFHEWSIITDFKVLSPTVLGPNSQSFFRSGCDCPSAFAHDIYQTSRMTGIRYCTSSCNLIALDSDFHQKIPRNIPE